MGPGALALVLTAAVLHAVWNLAAKGVTEDRLLFIWLYAALSVVRLGAGRGRLGGRDR